MRETDLRLKLITPVAPLRSIEDTSAAFIVNDGSTAKVLTKDEARRIAAYVAKLPVLLCQLAKVRTNRV